MNWKSYLAQQHQNKKQKMWWNSPKLAALRSRRGTSGYRSDYGIRAVRDMENRSDYLHDIESQL